ncbi:hypothetical protein [Curtobacterium flaccumfaciens]|uniref:hypothetical protein n=1 Tax=Curtobacterium flaccumfaciens TaxID=2035 RepID=UPI000FFF0AC1|nr:hypothetical protein [Curtobacterium flaccumfaciens]MCS0644956.1 hypothetical protein [Curtobacterium flaccumfaciens pv. flaccumfaciens]MCS6526756.1 hypothetical protein [Curtobacterium flaccumfaciens pv. flaccumfaciens]MCS6530513.1 hypothetical protein [Curtobacterium flaccumfaciens pv. flaccumfaciens]NUU12101.1 hypothetical protein [Curtobacterium flaccumfaciens]
MGTTIKRIYWVTATAALAGGLGYGMGLAIAGPHESTAGQWLLDFSKTAGAAAVAAVVAATIAFAGISRQVSANREQLKHQQKDAASQRWWESFEWAAARGIPAKKEDIALPYDTSMNTLFALRDSATSEVQRAACLGLIEELAKQLKTLENHGTPSTAEQNAWSALTKWATADTSASPTVRASIDEHETLSAIRALLEDRPDLVSSLSTNVRVSTSADARGSTGKFPHLVLDAVAEVKGVPIVIEITHSNDPARKMRFLRERLKGTEYERVPMLAITRVEGPNLSPVSRTPVRLLRWTPDQGPEPIAMALSQLASGATRPT